MQKCKLGKNKEREKERETERQRQRGTERQRQRERERETDEVQNYSAYFYVETAAKGQLILQYNNGSIMGYMNPLLFLS